MPVENKIIVEKRLIITRMFGDIDYADVISVNQSLMASPDFDPTYHQLVDLTGVGKINVSADVLRNFARAQVTFHKESRCAVVAPSDVVYGMARIYASVQSDREDFQIFRSYEAAQQWLAIEKKP